MASVKNSIIEGKGFLTFTTARSEGLGYFISARKSALEKGGISNLQIPKMAQWLALSRGDYWMDPFHGSAIDSIPQKTQFLLWKQTDKRFGILLPLIDGDICTTAKGTPKGLSLNASGALDVPESATLAFVGVGADPYILVNEAMKAVSEHLKTFRLREEKQDLSFSKYLGWCTWDAFYHDVTEKKVLEGLKSFRDGGVNVGFMILDDGWLDTTVDFLNTLGFDSKKFPDGLKPLIEKAKKDFGVTHFGIHHPFQGYWAGINPSGPLSKKYKTVKNKNNIRPWLGDNKNDLCFIHPDDIHRFYADWYYSLRMDGVDFVKVDGQSAMELFTEGKMGRVSVMRKYQEALQGAASMYFRSEIIQCMCHGSDVLYSMGACNAWRNSGDYFPNKPMPVQQSHIYTNAMNSIFSHTFGIPDWDMFQSHNPEAEFHAAARAISGGPVYVCDKPGKQNFALLRKLITSDGEILSCEHPSLPTEDRIFTDCRNEQKLLKIMNKNGMIGVLGLFQCYKENALITDSFKASDVRGIEGDLFAIYLQKGKELTVVKADQNVPVTLDTMQYELATISPIVNGIAPLGLLDKFNGSRALLRAQIGDESAVFRFCDGGRVGFYLEKKPSKVVVDNKKTAFTYDKKSGLLIITVAEGTLPEVVLYF